MGSRNRRALREEKGGRQSRTGCGTFPPRVKLSALLLRVTRWQVGPSAPEALDVTAPWSMGRRWLGELTIPGPFKLGDPFFLGDRSTFFSSSLFGGRAAAAGLRQKKIYSIYIYIYK